jgi:hypothetical protein
MWFLRELLQLLLSDGKVHVAAKARVDRSLRADPSAESSSPTLRS